jgi:hypothetical protein
MSKSVRARVGIVLVVVVILGVLVVPAASAGTSSAPSASTLSTTQAGGYGCYQSYRVRPGDTLTKIAYRFGTTVNALMRCNNIWNPDRIYIGQWLCICGGYVPPPKPRPQPRPQPKPCVQPCGQPCGQPCQPAPPPPCEQPCGQPCGQPCQQVPPPPPPPPPVTTSIEVDPPDPPPQPWPQPQPCNGPAPCQQPWPSKHPSCTVDGTCCTDARSVITSPRQGQQVHGWVSIIGTAVVKNFDYYKVEYGAGANPDQWSWLYSGGSQVANGTLAVWDASALPCGTYSIRVVVVDKTGNYPPPCQVTVVVR